MFLTLTNFKIIRTVRQVTTHTQTQTHTHTHTHTHTNMYIIVFFFVEYVPEAGR